MRNLAIGLSVLALVAAPLSCKSNDRSDQPMDRQNIWPPAGVGGGPSDEDKSAPSTDNSGSTESRPLGGMSGTGMGGGSVEGAKDGGTQPDAGKTTDAGKKSSAPRPYLE